MRKRWPLRNFNRSKFSFVRMEYTNKECFVHQKAPICCVRPKFSAAEWGLESYNKAFFKKGNHIE
jgi:hypothetical protein